MSWKRDREQTEETPVLTAADRIEELISMLSRFYFVSVGLRVILTQSTAHQIKNVIRKLDV